MTERLMIGGPGHGKKIAVKAGRNLSYSVPGTALDLVQYSKETFVAEGIPSLVSGEYLLWVHGPAQPAASIIEALRDSGLKPAPSGAAK